jgi:queuine tRNA-ribosyltransferase
LPHFEITHQDPTSKARVGKLSTNHGVIDTPVFMPVGTNATVKGVRIDALESMGCQIVLSNAYHLYLRPGVDLLKEMGGVREFMGWKGALLTDSGGYQIFSLDKFRKIKEEGLDFKSHIDGSKHFLSPEDVVKNQYAMGVDIMMPLDECVPYPCEEKDARRALDLTYRWLKRSKEAWLDLPTNRGHLFGIVQGSTWPALRAEGAQQFAELDLPGYSIGGLSVGEPQSLMMDMLDATVPHLPDDKPHYLMGVGYPDDVLLAIERGVDMFDCVIPTRNGRNGSFFTLDGIMQIRNARFTQDQKPLDDDCICYACQNLSRAYMRHLFQSKEMLGPELLSLHNLTFYIQLLTNIRFSIVNNSFQQYKKEFLTRYGTDNNE